MRCFGCWVLEGMDELVRRRVFLVVVSPVGAGRLVPFLKRMHLVVRALVWRRRHFPVGPVLFSNVAVGSMLVVVVAVAGFATLRDGAG